MNAKSTNIQVLKSSTLDTKKISLHHGAIGVETTLNKSKKESETNTEPPVRVEPQVQLVEIEPGVFDIIITCSCGECTTVRCKSVKV